MPTATKNLFAGEKDRPDSSRKPAGEKHAPPASSRSLHGLDVLNFFLADVQTGLGPFLAIFLATQKWNPEQVGIALTIGSLVAIAVQTPAGALVDRLRAKRLLIAMGVIALAAGALVLAIWPRRAAVYGSQVLIGAASSIFGPAVAAITLGLVGHELLDRRQGRNQAWNSAGNVFAALAMGGIGYWISPRWIFFLVVGFAIPTLASLLFINGDEIDYELSRGARDGVDHGRARIWELLRNRPLMIFLVCAVLFHFANAAMLPLLGEMLSQGKARSSPLFMAACVVTTQAVISIISSPVGRLAHLWGRKPLLLIGFGVLPIRGLLYVFLHRPYLLIGVQVLDGIGAGVFGVLSVLVIADLVRGTGRFNITQGAIATAVGIGASLSQGIAGGIVHYSGYRAGFLFLSAVAAAALVVLAIFMPETKGIKDDRNAGSQDSPK